MKEAVSRKKGIHQAMCKDTTEDNKNMYERRKNEKDSGFESNEEEGRRGAN